MDAQAQVAAPAGLTTAEAAARRRAGEANTPVSSTSRSYATILRTNVFSFYNSILFVIGAALLAMGRYNDAFVSVGLGLVNAVISAVQEIGAKRKLDGLQLLDAAQVVVVLMRPQPSSDHLGVGLALLAAGCWAAYILLNRTVGRRVPGLEGTAAAGAVSALAYVPVGIGVLLTHPPTPAALACAGAAGLLSSAVPFAVDLLALRRIPAHFFGIVMSVHPVFAAGIGAVVLGEVLVPLDWLGIALVVTANTSAVFIRSRTGR